MRNYNSKFKIFTFFIVFYYLFSIAAPLAYAVEEGLVPCGPGKNKMCEFCDLLQLTNNVINFALWNIAVPIVVIMVAYGGFVIMTAGDDTGKVTEGRKIFQAAIIGVLIALGAWLIISEILIAISPADKELAFKPWKWGDEDILQCPGQIKK